MRDVEDPPFQFEVHAFTTRAPDGTLASQPHGILGDGDDLWGTRSNKPEFLLNVPRIRRDLRHSDFDLLHVIQLDTIAYPTGAIGRSQPVVVGPDILGWHPVRSGGKWDMALPEAGFEYAKYATKRLLAATGRYESVTGYSEYHRSILEELGFPQRDISIIPPGVDPAFHSDDDGIADPPRLLYVGDLTQHKGIPVLMEALEQLDHTVEVTIVGAGTMEQNLPDYINFEGVVPRNELPGYYRDADLFVMPSIDEAGPNTIVEALASGVPVVATDKPGINEYPPEDTAVFFWPREPEALTSAIEEAIDRLPTLTRNIRRHASAFHPESVVDYLDSLYRRVLDEA